MQLQKIIFWATVSARQMEEMTTECDASNDQISF